MALAVAVSLHFLFASLMWGLIIYICLGRRDPWPPPQILWGALSSFLLLACFGVASLAAIQRRRIAGWVLAGGLLCGLGVFVYDVTTSGYLIRSESYQGHAMYLYPTWWWYNWPSDRVYRLPG